MELMEAVFGRRSVRHFLPDPVPRDAIMRLIDAAIHAPNAVNLQPWSFVVVQDQRLLDRISNEAKSHLTGAGSMDSLPAHIYEKLRDPQFHLFYHAPLLIVISANAQGPWIVEDCSLAAENLMLSAHAAGIGSCWIGLAQGWLNTPQGKEAIGVPKAYVPVAPIILGLPKSAAPPVPRRGAEIHWIGP
jgi:nitroreductase